MTNNTPKRHIITLIFVQYNNMYYVKMLNGANTNK